MLNTVKDYILTGIPRSGTSLMSTILCHSVNSYCFNEVHYDVESLPDFFKKMRSNIKKGLPIRNKSYGNEVLATDTQSEDFKVLLEDFRIRKDMENLKLGSNVNIPYLNQIERIIRFGYPIIAMVRDPVYTIASWNKSLAIPEAHVEDNDMHPRWKGFNFTIADKLSRQAIIWEHYMQIISNVGEIKIVKYEELISNYSKTLMDISDYLGIAPPIYDVPIKNGNEPNKYINLKKIQNIVATYCTTREQFGYS